tara:strand:- start:6539 stop:6691 length:153 start_codon:yes stop_codon:yes gene_type:complete
MPKKNMNNIINIDEDVIKSDKDNKKVRQNIFEGKEIKKPKQNKKSNNKYK